VKRFVFALTIILSCSLTALPAWQQINRVPPSVGITGQVIVPVPGFQQIFEVLLLQNAEQVVQATVAGWQLGPAARTLTRRGQSS